MKKCFIYLVFTLLSVSGIYAQVTVKGNVKDDMGEALIGAVVLEKGTTNNGVITDVNGNFTIKVKNDQAVLRFSTIGFTTAELPVKGNKFLMVVLNSASTQIEEVVVVAYGQQKKASVTGAISSIGASELKQSATASVSNSLTGRIVGLVTRQVSGRPGEDAADMFIRGRATPNGSAPLIMVDGVERDFTQIDPDEIESVSVLKDASATAVYGVRGANGVILVTTKRGKVAKAQISFSGEFGLTQANRIAKMVNSEEYAMLMNEGLINDGKLPKYSEEDMRLYRTQESPFTHPDRDGADMFIRLGSQQKYNVNITGGTKAVKYFVSMGYFDQSGIYETDIDKLKKHPDLARLIELSPGIDERLQQPDYDPDFSFQRYNFRSNLDIQVTKDFKVGIDFSYRTEIKSRPGVYGNAADGSQLFQNLIRTPANSFPLVNPDGSFAAVTNLIRANSLNANLYSGYRKNNDSALEGTITFNYDLHKVTEGLSVGGKFSYNNYFGSIRALNVQNATWSFENGKYVRLLGDALPTIAGGRNGAKKRIYGEFMLNYKRTFNEKHNVAGVVLYNYNSLQKPGSGDNTSYGDIPQIYQGAVARFNYDYDGRYLLELNMGYNGSNRFDKSHRYQLFPAASIGWIATNEEFLKESKILSLLKVRGSIGQVGNDNFGNNFDYYYAATYAGGDDYNFGITPNGGGGGLLEGRAGNPNVGWEVATKANVGVETSWFNSQLTLNADIFYEHRTDILRTSSRINMVSGITAFAPSNIMAVDNKGFEVELGWRSKINKLDYWVRGNMAFARNEIIEMSEQNRAYDYLRNTGQSVGQKFLYIADGLYNSWEEIAAGPEQFGTLQPGDIRYRDINADGVINDNDIVPYGYSDIPEITGSVRLGISWKGLDVNLMLQGATHSTLTTSGEIAYEFSNYASALKDKHLGRWTPETQNSATYHRITSSSATVDNNFINGKSSFYSYDSSYLRLKSVEVGYTFPKKLFKGTPISSLRVYVNGFNLYTWDHIKLLDPEMDPNKSSGSFYPQQRVYNGGINVVF